MCAVLGHRVCGFVTQQQKVDTCGDTGRTSTGHSAGSKCTEKGHLPGTRGRAGTSENWKPPATQSGASPMVATWAVRAAWPFPFSGWYINLSFMWNILTFKCQPLIWNFLNGCEQISWRAKKTCLMLRKSVKWGLSQHTCSKSEPCYFQAGALGLWSKGHRDGQKVHTKPTHYCLLQSRDTALFHHYNTIMVIILIVILGLQNHCRQWMQPWN